MGIDIPLPGASLRYYPDYVTDADRLFCALRDGIDWQQPQLKVFGQWHPTPRLVAFVGDEGVSYRYSAQRHQALPWPDVLCAVRRQLRLDFDLDFNSALLNYYRDGDDSMGWHSDDEPELGAAPAIASLSLGDSRDFRFRPFPGRHQAGSPTHTVTLENGSLLLMLPPTQEFWQHSLPRRARRGPRINITFRNICR